MEPYTSTHSSIFGDSYDTNDTFQQYNNLSLVDPGAMLNPIAVVEVIAKYIGLFTDILSSTMLFYVLKIFIGESLAHVITMILNIMFFLVLVRVISGRIRWE